MKVTLLLFCLLGNIVLANAQSLTYTQLHKVFDTWMRGKGKNVPAITTQLHTINLKWKIMSLQPGSDEESKYWVWTTLDTQKDTTAVALYIEEDESTTKYSLRYAFHSAVGYQAMVKSLKTDPYYNDGSISTQVDNSKGLASLLALPNEALPMNQRFDFLLSDYNLNSSDGHPRLFTVDLWSRYIPKQANR